MKNLTIVLTMLMVFGAASALAMHHEQGGHGSHGAAKPAAHQGHGSHGDHADMQELGTVVAKGVEGMAELKDVRASMAKLGQKTTHHFMVMFHEARTGKPVESGKVAVKITTPDGTIAGPVELIGMDGHFGADVILDKPGEYRFQIGSKLADGEARQFEFATVIK